MARDDDFIAVGAALLAAIVPMLVLLIRRVDQFTGEVAQANRVVTAQANHRHGEDGAPTFIIPAAPFFTDNNEQRPTSCSNTTPVRTQPARRFRPWPMLSPSTMPKPAWRP